MKATIKNGVLHLEVPMQSATPSATGKTLVVASSHGNQTTGAQVDGRPVVVSLNAFVYPPRV